jgi:putative Mg2+ transporter-C (MgtC) family protein
MSDLEMSARLALAVFFGALIGIERQWHHKTAGLKTNSLTALGVCGFTLASQLGFSNPSQVAAGVLTGVGFIGGGVIIRQGGSIQGVNSAATLWVTAAGAMLIGIGRYHLALVLLGLTLIIQLLLRRIADWVDHRSKQGSARHTALFGARDPEQDTTVRNDEIL